MDSSKEQPLLDYEAVIEILNQIALFGALNDEQLYKVFKLLKKISYKKGSFIFNQGDSPKNIFIVLSGKVELVLDANGEYLVKGLLEEGQCFGETAVIGIEKHSASAVAADDTQLIVFSRQDLFSLWETDKDLFTMLVLNIAREACRRLSNSDKILLHYYLNNETKDVGGKGGKQI